MIAFALAATISLLWNPNPETNIAGYKLYYGTASGSYTSVINVSNVTAYTVTNLPASSRFYFALTAYNTLGQESPFSNEVAAFTPISPPSGFRFITNSLQGATSLNGPWNTMATYVTPLETNHAQLFVRDELRISQ